MTTIAVLRMTSVVITLAANTVSAQRVVSSVDVAGSGVWYADSIRSTGPSLSPTLQFDWAHATLATFANVSRLGGMSVQAGLTPSLSTPKAGAFSGEVSASLGGSSHHDGTKTGEWLVVARGYASVRDGGGWMGVGSGRTWDGNVWRTVRQAELGGLVQRGAMTALMSLSPVVVQDTIRYTDIQTALRYPTRTVEWGASAGIRAGSVGPAVGGNSRVWGGVNAVVWMSSQVALVGSAGTYPIDLTQGYPGGRFVTVALRFASRNSRAAPEPSAAPRNETRPTGAVSGFEVRTVTGTRRALRVNAPAATVVEVSGDFTHWQPVRLTRGSDGWWSVTLPIPVGTHQMNVRLNGGPWMVPPGLLSTVDEFGGTVGILSVR